MSEFIGPARPPGLRKEEDKLEIGPQIPTSDASIGPRLPPNLRATTRITESDEIDDSIANKDQSRVDSSCYGPSLPSVNSATPAKSDDHPTATSVEESDSYGPSLPPGFQARVGHGEDSEQPPTNSRIIGPALPPAVGWGLSETEADLGKEEEDDVIGPVPMMGGVSEVESVLQRRREFESRSKAMKNKLLGKVSEYTHTHAPT